MCAYNEFYRSHLSGNFKAAKILPKKQFTQDPLSIKAVMNVFRKGGSVAIAPEGIATMYGESHPIIAGTLNILTTPEVRGSFTMKGMNTICRLILEILG